jgi:hypothetical protein
MDDSMFRPSDTLNDVIRNIKTILLGILNISLESKYAVVVRMMVDFISVIKKEQEAFHVMVAADENFLTRIQFSFHRRLNE